MSDIDATGDMETSVEGRELVMSRTFDAPRELVWKAWTEPERLRRWFGPRGWTLPFCELDLRPGGAWRYAMRGPEGEESWGRAVYREVAPPERLVYIDSFSDAGGNPIEGMPIMDVTLEFAEHDGTTTLTSRARFASPEDLQAVLDMGVIQGMTETWDRLAEHLRDAS